MKINNKNNPHLKTMKKLVFAATTLLSLTFYNAQIGINTNHPKATLDIQKQTSGSGTVGILIPRITQLEAENVADSTPNSTMVFIESLIDSTTVSSSTPLEKTAYVNVPGYYYFDAQKEKWINVNDRPAFYYTPSILLPTEKEDPRLDSTNPSYDPNFTYDSLNKKFKVNIYNIFKKQFEQPIASSNPTSNLTRFVRSNIDYNYYVTYADTNVFTLSSDAITPSGELTYEVNENGIIRNGSFMNIVIAEK